MKVFIYYENGLQVCAANISPLHAATLRRIGKLWTQDGAPRMLWKDFAAYIELIFSYPKERS